MTDGIDTSSIQTTADTARKLQGEGAPAGSTFLPDLMKRVGKLVKRIRLTSQLAAAETDRLSDKNKEYRSDLADHGDELKNLSGKIDTARTEIKNKFEDNQQKLNTRPKSY